VGYTPTVTADKDTNILMLKLRPKHYKILLPFIEELDKLPLQTLVEVTVAEVTMTDTFSLGFEYAITNESKNLPKALLNITGGGSGLGVVFQGNYLDATINAFAEKQLLNIVSRPKILILNNSTGNINVGTQVPIITSETSASDLNSGTTPSINRNISYRNTGIVLGLTPTINSNGILTMNISINLSEAQLNDTSGIDSPLIVNRTLDTTAVIKSGDTILIGGLISENKSTSKGGIPGLKDIPFIGDIFASNSKKTTKTELIMLIRPIIIKTAQEIDSETYKFKQLMQVLNTADL
jgi:general secretion pathway protein D